MTHHDPHPAQVLETLRRRGPGTRIAVAGASTHPAKYGNIIVRNLKQKGYTVLPMNPKEEQIEGLRVAKGVSDLESPVDILCVVTPPPVTLGILKEAAAAGIPAVWLQDGSYDDAVLAYVHTAPFKTVYEACIMVASNS